MVTDRKEDSGKTPEKQGAEQSASEPNKITASTPYDFDGRNLTPYGGPLPVITMLEKARLRVAGHRDTDIEADSPCHGPYGFVLAIVCTSAFPGGTSCASSRATRS